MNNDQNVIRLSITTNGRTGQEWITALERDSILYSGYVESILTSPDFQPEPAGTHHEIVILKGALLPSDERTIPKIQKFGIKNSLRIPNAEIACLIREKLTDADIARMGITRLLTMHEPRFESGHGWLLGTSYQLPTEWLLAYPIGGEWTRGNGFAFVS